MKILLFVSIWFIYKLSGLIFKNHLVGEIIVVPSPNMLFSIVVVTRVKGSNLVE